MSVQLSPPYSYVTRVSRYPFLTAVNLSLHECPIKTQIVYALNTLLVSVTFRIR